MRCYAASRIELITALLSHSPVNTPFTPYEIWGQTPNSFFQLSAPAFAPTDEARAVPFEPDTELGAFHVIRLVRDVFLDRGGDAETDKFDELEAC